MVEKHKTSSTKAIDPAIKRSMSNWGDQARMQGTTIKYFKALWVGASRASLTLERCCVLHCVEPVGSLH